MSQLFSAPELVNAQGTFKPKSVDDEAITIIGLANQSEDLLSVQNSAGTEVFKISNAGAITAAGAQTLNENVTIASGKTLAVTTADKLTVGGVIVPQHFYVSFNVPAGAAAADYDGNIPIPDAAEIVSVTERHQTAGNDAGAVTVMVKKVPSGTARGSGTDTLSAGISLKGTADTNAAGSLHATPANYQFAAGDSVALVTTGTLTAVDGVSVTVKFKRI